MGESVRDFFDEFIALQSESESGRADEGASGERGDGCVVWIVAVGAKFGGFDDVRLNDIFIERAEGGLQGGPCRGDALRGGGVVFSGWRVQKETAGGMRARRNLRSGRRRCTGQIVLAQSKR